MNDACYFVDRVSGRCVADGIAGARIDLAAMPSVDIANGAPTGQGATNELVDAWSDGRFGFNNEKTLLSYSTNGGATWSAPSVVSEAGDRSVYSAPGSRRTGGRSTWCTWRSWRRSRPPPPPLGLSTVCCGWPPSVRAALPARG
jgi:hypothetical protein